MPDAQLESLVTAVTTTPKYRHISPDLVRRIGMRELTIRRSTKEAIKATKNKLHQIGGAYLESRIDYPKWLNRLQEAADSPQTLPAVCEELMRFHASTRERLPILNTFYAQLFAALPPVHTVLDLACGFNPLAVPWMPLPAGATYYACDVYADMMAFLQDAIPLLGVRGHTEVRDLAGSPPALPVDLALMLKTLPVLDQVNKTAVPRLLDTIQARHLLITFPVRSLGGRSKGMIKNYTSQLDAWRNGRSWQVDRFEFATELAFLITCKPEKEDNACHQ